MHTAAGLAKKYGLEEYLDKPAELNQAIFNLMLLQETIQLEQLRRKKRDEPASALIALKRSVYGKFMAACSGDERFRYAVETAFKASTDTLAVFHRGRFVKALQSMGLPEDKISEFCRTVTLEDDTHCVDPE